MTWTKDTSQSPDVIYTNTDDNGLTRVVFDPDVTASSRITGEFSSFRVSLVDTPDFDKSVSGGQITYTPDPGVYPGLTKVVFTNPGITWLLTGIEPNTSQAVVHLSFISNSASTVTEIDKAFGLV